LNCFFFFFFFFLLVSVAAEFKKLGVGLDMNLDWISGLVFDFPFECIMGFTLLLLLLLLVLLFFMMFIVDEYNKSGIVLFFFFFFWAPRYFSSESRKRKKEKKLKLKLTWKLYYHSTSFLDVLSIEKNDTFRGFDSVHVHQKTDPYVIIIISNQTILFNRIELGICMYILSLIDHHSLEGIVYCYYFCFNFLSCLSCFLH